MATTPQYASIPKNTFASLTTANSALTGASAVIVFTAGASGARIDTIHMHATGTTTAGMIRIFCGAAADATAALIAEIPVLANTPNSTNPAWSADVDIDLIMQANYILSATTANTQTFDVMIKKGGSF